MKIAVVSTSVFPIHGPPHFVRGYAGLEVLAGQIAYGLAQKGHEVFLVAPDGSEIPGVTTIPIGPARLVDEKRAWGGFPALRDSQGKMARAAHAGYWQYMLSMDAIIDHSWMKYSYLLKAEGRLKCPILGVLHAPVNTMYSSLPPVEKPSFVCISQDQANHFNALFAPATAKVAYNGIDLDFYKPLEGIKRTDRFLFLARFSSIKGSDLAVDACKQSQVGLDLVGDTTITQEPDYFRQVEEKCDGKQIRMVGPASRGECVKWFSQAHCFLHPNKRFREPLGLAPLEAQACGLPVIAWRYGAMKETIKENETGWLVSSEEDLRGCIKAAIQTTGSGPLVPITEKTRIRCREWASQWSIKRMVDRYEVLCQEAVDSGGW